MMKIIFLILAVFSFSAVGDAQGARRRLDMCEVIPKIENLAEKRCVNFTQFSEEEVNKAKEGCLRFYESVKSAVSSICEYSKETEAVDAESKRALQHAGQEPGKLRKAHAEIFARTIALGRRWSRQFDDVIRIKLNGANDDYKNSLSALNEFGLELLKKEASACGGENSSASPAYIGLALTAGYEGAYTHKFVTDVFMSMANAMDREIARSEAGERSIDEVPKNAPAPKNSPREEEPGNSEPAIKLIISEAISHALKLEGLSSLGIDLADKLLIQKKMDTLDLVVLSIKAMIIAAGGGSAGPTVGASLGIALSINLAIDYLDHGIRKTAGSFERVTHSRMDELLLYHSCKARKKSVLSSTELARSYHEFRKDGVCGAKCEERGMFGVCRPSLVFTIDRCD